MGVEGLLTFIRSNDDLLIKRHRLHHTKIVIDSNNLTSYFIRLTDKRRKYDLLNVDYAKFELQVENFIDTLHRCKIEPKFVFDANDTRGDERSQKIDGEQDIHQEKLTSDVEALIDADSEIQLLCEVFKSIIADKKDEIVQCSTKADNHIAKLANELDCPVLSSDSDFFILDLKNGLIPIEMLDYKRAKFSRDSKPKIDEKDEPYHYIECCLFTQDNFVQFFPSLDKRCLPLLGVLAGNDMTNKRRFAHLVDLLPMRELSEKSGLNPSVVRSLKKQQLKILKILYFMCGKSLEQNINTLISKVAKNRRKDLKVEIRHRISLYLLEPTTSN